MSWFLLNLILANSNELAPLQHTRMQRAVAVFESKKLLSQRKQSDYSQRNLEVLYLEVTIVPNFNCLCFR